MHILVCDDDAAFSAKVAEYAATYFEAHEIPVQATVCSDPEQVLAIPDLELMKNGVELSVSRSKYAAVRAAYLEWKGQFGDE